MADQAPYLGEAYDKNKAMMLSKEELDLLLLYNAYLYKTAAEGILNGQFAINPYSENGRISHHSWSSLNPSRDLKPIVTSVRHGS